MNDIELQRNLSDRELSIFNSELQRRQKHVLVSYVLWFFLGWVGAHKFYLGKPLWGVLYIAFGVGGYVLFFGGFMAATGDPDAAEGAADASAFGILLGGLWALFMLWDMVSLPSQHNRHEVALKRRLLRQFEE